MGRFKLVKGGAHTENGRTYKVGDVITSNQPLDKMFGRTGKFMRLDVSPEPEESVGAPAPPEPTQALDYGADVTAVAAGGLLETRYRVFQKGPWYSFIDTVSGKKLNDKALKRDQVSDFAAELMGQ